MRPKEGGLRRRAATVTSDSAASSLSAVENSKRDPPCKTWAPSILSNELWAHTRLASGEAGVFKERAEKPWMKEGRLSRNAKAKG